MLLRDFIGVISLEKDNSANPIWVQNHTIIFGNSCWFRIIAESKSCSKKGRFFALLTVAAVFFDFNDSKESQIRPFGTISKIFNAVFRVISEDSIRFDL